MQCLGEFFSKWHHFFISYVFSTFKSKVNYTLIFNVYSTLIYSKI